MKYIDAEKLIAEIERQQRSLTVLSIKGTVDIRRDSAIQNGVYDHILGIIKSLQQEQPEVDLDAIVNEAFDKYSSVDGYGQLSVSFNRAELYSFIKKIARKEE